MTESWDAPMRRALELAVAEGTSRGLNPRVGCVIIRDGRIVAEGFHAGAGTAHAEVVALANAGEKARGATAVVTLEPCAHVGRTGPCAQALIAAGIARVVYAQSDPTELASGGADLLRAAGVDVVPGVLAQEASAINADWSLMKSRGRPFVILKLAGSLDGRVDSDGPDRLLLTGPEAGVAVQQLRADVDAIAVGTGTVTADDPLLTVRGGDRRDAPLRVVLGSSAIPHSARVLSDEAPTLIIHDHDPAKALEQLSEMGVQRLLLEGGPTVASAYLRSGLVDEVHWFVAPVLVGGGPIALADLGAQVALDVSSVDLVGEDVRIIGVPVPVTE